MQIEFAGNRFDIQGANRLQRDHRRRGIVLVFVLEGSLLRTKFGGIHGNLTGRSTDGWNSEFAPQTAYSLISLSVDLANDATRVPERS
jgi:hypothetical protein